MSFQVILHLKGPYGRDWEEIEEETEKEKIPNPCHNRRRDLVKRRRTIATSIFYVKYFQEDN
jgi:hypothetical protein